MFAMSCYLFKLDQHIANENDFLSKFHTYVRRQTVRPYNRYESKFELQNYAGISPLLLHCALHTSAFERQWYVKFFCSTNNLTELLLLVRFVV